MLKNIIAVVIAGNQPKFSILKRYIYPQVKTFIACDSGLDYLLKADILADYWLGDMDSTHYKHKINTFSDKMKIISHSPLKDKTDCQLGLELAYHLAASSDRICLIGGGNHLYSHQLALLALFQEKFYPHIWITDKEKICLIDKFWSQYMPLNSLISVFPLPQHIPNRMYSYGLYWPLKKINFKQSHSLHYSLHNISTEYCPYIQIENGISLLIHPIQYMRDI